MAGSTSVLFGLEGEFVDSGLERVGSSDLTVVMEHRDPEAACPGYWVFTSLAGRRS